jgi:hypothetical protein
VSGATKACPQCATELPEEARFCGNCGQRFDGPPAQAPAAAAPAAAASTAAPAAAASTAASTAADNGASSFQLVAADYGRAFERLCEQRELVAPADLPTDHESYFAAAKALGADKLPTEKALHRVSIEKIPEAQRRKMGIVLEDDIEPATRSPWVPVIIAVNVIAAIVIVLVIALQEDPPPRPPMDLKPQKGSIDTGALESAFDAVATAARNCYQAALKSDKTLAGDVVLTLRIGLDGKAAEARLSKDELNKPEVASCILEAARAQAYPAAENAPVDVDLPLSFAPGS